MATLNDTTDAKVWASEFVRIFRRADDHAEPDRPITVLVDEGTMIAWFANAIETGRTAGRQELCPHDDSEMMVCRVCGKITHNQIANSE